MLTVMTSHAPQVYAQQREAAGEPSAPPAQPEEPPSPPEKSQDAAPPSATPQLYPPKLIQFVEAEYPEHAREDGLEARVVLRLTIDAQGEVTEAIVAEPVGHGFDEAAREAALQFRFTPARRGETPVPSRILYTYAFELPKPPPRGDVAGRIVMPDDPDEGVAGALVTLIDEQGDAVVEARTDAQGQFEVEGIAPGTYTLRAEAEGLGAITLPVTIEAGATTTPTLRLIGDEEAAPIEVTVRGTSKAQELRESAQAVQVVEIGEQSKRTADLGEVLAREEGVGVRRGGGLGSAARFSLNGLTGDQIRFFLDGVPLEFAGYPFGIANVPVNFIDRVEIYRGVAPTRFGADALGGAVNLVTDEALSGTNASTSYQVGSFGTHRLTAGASHLFEPLGFFVRAQGFVDHADNDYFIDVEVPNEVGRLSPARVYRFHDAYDARGASIEAGFVNTPWADRLILRAFLTEFEREIQHNIVMTVPYGDVTTGASSSGATLRYEHRPRKDVSLSVVGGYSYERTNFRDVGECVYDWFGRCIRERRQAGEIEPFPRDPVLWDHNGFARVNAQWRLVPRHRLRLSVAPTFVTRTGDERRQTDPDARDPLTAQRDAFSQVTGLEYEADVLGDALENIAFAKHYLQTVRSEEPLVGGGFQDRDRTTQRLGVGDALRYRIISSLWAKASYEWATRLPRPEEIFGDGQLIVDNLELEPETSHNVNLGLTLDARETRWGSWRSTINGFLRDADNLIILLGNDRVFSYQNVFGARSVGVEAAVGWTSPGQWLSLDGNVTYQDFRNTSDEGTFGDFEGDRIPNRPYLFANGMGRLQYRGAASSGDELALVWNTRYVHEFFRGWESVGLRNFKQTVDDQLTHTAALTYSVDGDPLALSFTGEVQNLTDAQVFDFFGVQRPGRAFYFKVTAQY